ncbi:MAG: EAL domain-containing protein [Gammaproteobacteria bacterium]|nr:EAL domain-containing protein [Gammaproteobacteria bacterium]
MIRNKTLFLGLSLVIFLLVAISFGVNYLLNRQEMMAHLNYKSDLLYAAFHSKVESKIENLLMQGVSLANAEAIRDLLAEANRVVTAEGGGEGGEASAQLRQQLYRQVEPLWRDSVNRFGSGHLCFYLAEDGGSFLRIAAPQQFGQPPLREHGASGGDFGVTTGFEIGHTFFGLRSTVPVMVDDPFTGASEYVATVEVGTAFDPILEGMERNYAAEVAVILNQEKEKGGDAHRIAIASNPGVEEILEQLHLTPQQMVEQNEVQLLPWRGSRHAVALWPLRGLALTQEQEQSAPGVVIFWWDIAAEEDLLRHNLQVNLLYLAIAFILMELLLFFGFKYGTRFLRLQVEMQGNELLRQRENERRLNQESHTLQLTYARAINTISYLLNKESNSQKILDGITSLLGSTLKVERMAIYDVQLLAGEIKLLSLWKDPEEDIPQVPQQFQVSRFPHILSWMQRNNGWIESHHLAPHALLQEDGCIELFHQKFAMKSLLWIPFHNHGEGQGFKLATFNHFSRDRSWHKSKLQFLLEMMQLVSTGLTKIEWLSERTAMLADLELAATAFDTFEAIVITDSNGNIMRVNDSFTRITGYPLAEVVGRNMRLLGSGRHNNEFFRKMWQQLVAVGEWQGEIWNRRKNGEIYPQLSTISRVEDERGEAVRYVGNFIDISEQKRAEEVIHHQANYDALTDLPNRRLFLDYFQENLLRMAREGRYGALLLLDLDHFKNLNDTLGHSVGDRLLMLVSDRLSEHLRGNDGLSRQGGDEFVILLTDLGTSREEAEDQARKVAEKLLKVISEPYTIDQATLNINTSIGIALFPDGDEEVDELMKFADLAMYRAKERGRNGVELFEASLRENLVQRMEVERELRHALQAGDQFHLLWQPQVAADGTLVGAEGLIRWDHPEKGIISPGLFIPISEETGQILAIGDWVIAECCRLLARWLGEGLLQQIETISINISPRQFFQHNFSHQLLEVFEQYAIPHEKVCLELTEGLFISDTESAINKMAFLNQRGFRFSVDDFGTGYSSLLYLKKLPLAELKIDQSFVRDLTDDGSDAAIVQTIIAMSKTLGLSVVAEGVETREQLEFLEQHHCDIYQGYHFSRPLAVDDFEAVLRRGRIEME